MVLNQKMVISVLLLGILSGGIFLGTFPANALQSNDLVLSNLRSSGKLHFPDEILADYIKGESETAVIILLQPTEEAMALSARSRLFGQVPAEFTRPGAPAYYNLQDEYVRSQLKATVTETVNRVIGQLQSPGMTVTQKFSYQFGFAAKVTPLALEWIVLSPDVMSVERDHILHAHLAQGIPLMNAVNARSVYTGAGTSIAICDTGIDTSHPRMGGGGFPNTKVIGGYDTGDNDADPRPNSVSGNAHGTACAGIAAGNSGTVGDYIGGVASDAKLYAIKISIGTTGSASNSTMIAGWEWSINHQNDDPANPILIVSTSFGGGRYSTACDSAVPSMTTAAANAVAAGITIFASSGNDGYCDSMGWPACISHVNSVGAVYEANFGTYYPCISNLSCAPTKTATTGCSTGWYATDNTNPDRVTSYSNSAPFLTLFAPSNQAYTTDIVGAGGYASGDYYSSFGGTSAACPYAAGSAAVLQQAAKAVTGAYLTPAQIKTLLTNNGDTLTDGKVALTKPRINLGRTVDALISMPAPVLTNEPAVTPGTENTIFWNAVTPSGDISLAGGSLLLEPSTPKKLSPIGVNSTEVITENNESDNEYTKSISVEAAPVDYFAECADNGSFNAARNSGWTSQRQWTFQGLTPGQTYWYRVKAKSGTTESSWSNIIYSQQESYGSFQLSAPTFSVNENGGSAIITVTRNGGSNGAVGVNYSTSNGTAASGSDYTAASGTLNWANGDTASKTFSIPIINDSLYEGNETVNLALSSPTGGASLGSPNTAILTVVDNDQAPAGSLQFSITTFSVNENGGSAIITVTRNGGSNGAVGVNYSTSNGTAASGSDYTAASGTLNWANGDTASKTFSIPIINDSLYEGNETVNLALSSPTGGASLGSPNTAILTVVDNDQANYTADRKLPGSYTPGHPSTVTITITPASATQSYAAEEIPPDGWIISEISHNGGWDAAQKKVKWGQFFDNISRVLSYKTTPPLGERGPKNFTGTVSFDGSNSPIAGDTSLNSGQVMNIHLPLVIKQ